MENSDSILTIGGYDLEQYALSELTWHNLMDGSLHWDLNLTQIKHGDKVLVDTPASITVDSGSSLMVVPIRTLRQLK